MPVRGLPKDTELDPRKPYVDPKTQIKPVRDFILVRREQSVKESAGGIAFADVSKTRYEGVVIAVGPDVDNEVARRQSVAVDETMHLARADIPTVYEDDRILFFPHAGIPIKRGEEDLILIKADAIAAVLQ